MSRLTPSPQDTTQPWRSRPLALARQLRPFDEIYDWPHLLEIERVFLDAYYGNGPRKIIINMPPQHGKSQTTSRDIPTWYLDQSPDRNVMLASYQERYASIYTRMVRDTINESQGQLNVQIRADTRSRTEWYTTEDGMMIAQGIEGSFTGRRGDLVIIDDPIKNSKQANSPTERENVWTWYKSTIETRLHPESIVMVVMTRWHEDDLVGRLLDNEPDEWLVLRYPALAEENDPLGREPGEALCPDLFPTEYLHARRAVTDAYTWSGMYQQLPTQPDGAIVKRAWYVGMRNRYAWSERFKITMARYISIDTAESDDPTAAYSVAHISEFTHDRKLRLSGVDRRRLEPHDLAGWVKELIDVWDFDGKLAGIVIEAKSTGVSLISTLKRILPSRYRKMLFTYRPRDSKDDRLKRASIWMANGSYELPYVDTRAPNSDVDEWLAPFEQELFTAPMSRYRDQVDSAAQQIIFLEMYLEQGYSDRTRRVGHVAA